MLAALTSKLSLALTLGMLTLIALPSAIAGDGVTAAGQCYNADGTQGGEDYAEVDTTNGASVLPNVLSGHGAIEAAVLLATQTVADGSPGKACKAHDCLSGCDTAGGEKQRWDYLLVQVRAGGNTFSVCYVGAAGGSQNVLISPAGDACPTRPSGPA